MAWLEQTYMNGQHKYWTDTDTGEIAYTRPSGEIVTVAPKDTWTANTYMDGQHTYYTNDKTGEVVYNKDATLTDAEREQQFMQLWQNPNVSSFEKAQAVQKQYGIETLAQLVNQGQFSDVPDIGAYVAARQREANDKGFQYGNGNAFGIWPVLLGTGAFAALGAAGAGAAGAAAGEGAAAGSTAGATTGGVSASAGGEFAGGLTGTAAGSPGLAAGGFNAANLGVGGAATAPGLAAPAAGATGAGALSSGFFAGESMYPVLGGLSASTGATGLGSASSGAANTAAQGAGASSILSNPSLVGAGLGAAASILGGGNKPAGTTTTVEDIPEWLKPYANQGMAGLSSAFQASPGGVNPLTQQGGGYLSDVIGGDYLNSNPYLDAMFGRAAGKVSAGVNSQFSGAGRYGSGAHQGVLGESLGNLATDIYGGNYTRERANQQAAALGSGSFGNTMINQPFLPGQNLLSGVNSIKGGSKSSPYFENQFADLLSGALGGAMIGKSFA